MKILALRLANLASLPGPLELDFTAEPLARTRVAGRDVDFEIGGGGTGQLTSKLRDKLVGIQNGTVEDRHGWVTPIA